MHLSAGLSVIKGKFQQIFIKVFQNDISRKNKSKVSINFEIK